MVRRMGDFGEEVVQSVPQAPERCAGCGMYPDEIDPKKECEAGGTLGHHMIAVDELGRALPSVAAQVLGDDDLIAEKKGSGK
jgi:hypothetical protein